MRACTRAGVRCVVTNVLVVTLGVWRALNDSRRETRAHRRFISCVARCSVLGHIEGVFTSPHAPTKEHDAHVFASESTDMTCD